MLIFERGCYLPVGRLLSIIPGDAQEFTHKLCVPTERWRRRELSNREQFGKIQPLLYDSQQCVFSVSTGFLWIKLLELSIWDVFLRGRSKSCFV